MESALEPSFFNGEVPVTLKYTDREDRRATITVEMAHGSARRDLCTLASAWLSLAYRVHSAAIGGGGRDGAAARAEPAAHR